MSGTLAARRRPQKLPIVRETVGHGTKTEAVREQAILALLTEKSIATAATKSGINERTLRRWLSNDAGFRDDYAAARHAAYEAGMSRLQALAARAVETLEELMGEKRHPHVRLGAARTVTELAMHQHDAEAILKRLDELEQAMAKTSAREDN